MQVSLVMFKADGTRRDFPVLRDRMIIGRKNNCDLRIPLSSVSRQHCEVRVEGDQIKVRDLGSSNGTYHNSIRIQEAFLAAGDELVVGPVVFTVVIDGEPSEIRPVRTLVSGQEEVTQGASPSLDDLDEDDRPQTPEAIDTTHPDDSMPHVEPEFVSPTVDLDDPIAALERLAEAERENSANGGIDFDFFDDEDEDDEDEDKK